MDEFDFFKGLFNGMRCAILSFDRQGRIVVINDLAVQVLDLATLPTAGTPLDEVLSVHPQLLHLLKDCFRVTSLPNREELILGAGDSQKTIGYTISLITPEEGPPAGAAVFFKDLTQIERKEEQERLKDRLAALGQMAACLAHEIRNPLASIEVTCSLLKRRLVSQDSGHELLDKIVAEVRRLNRTISSSLEFVRPIMMNFSSADPIQLLEEAIDVAFERRGDKAVEIVREFDPRIPELLADRVQLRQVFENLLVNAVEAVEEGGVITVGAQVQTAASCDGAEGKPTEQSLIVEISDDGPGVASEGQERLFYPFFTTKEHGSGVGLSMAKKIVDGHYGLIDVSNSSAGGARFTVRLPMQHDEAED